MGWESNSGIEDASSSSEFCTAKHVLRLCVKGKMHWSLLDSNANGRTPNVNAMIFTGKISVLGFWVPGLFYANKQQIQYRE